VTPAAALSRAFFLSARSLAVARRPRECHRRPADLLRRQLECPGLTGTARDQGWKYSSSEKIIVKALSQGRQKREDRVRKAARLDDCGRSGERRAESEDHAVGACISQRAGCGSLAAFGVLSRRVASTRLRSIGGARRGLGAKLAVGGTLRSHDYSEATGQHHTTCKRLFPEEWQSFPQ